MSGSQDKPNFLVYAAYFGLCAIVLNTVYMVLPNDQLRWYLIAGLVIAMATGYMLDTRHYSGIGILIDLAGLGVTIYYGWQIWQDRMAFGTYLGEMLSVLLVLRCFRLFRYQDFLLPMVISLTLMVFSAIPSFSAEFIYSLLGYLLFLGLAMFLGSIDEFARLPGRTTKHSRWKYTYDFLEEYKPVPVSRKPPRQLKKFVGPAIRSSVPAVLTAFLLSSAFYFTVDHTYAPGTDSTFLSAFSNTDLDNDPRQEQDLLTGVNSQMMATHYTGFDTEFNIAQGRLIENSTSTETVMEVESNLPSYWRGKCFDTYTGRGWTQAEDIPVATWSLDPPGGRRSQYHGEINNTLEDQGIELDPQVYKDEVRQTFYLETNLPGVVFSAYQPVELSLPVPAVTIDDTFTIIPPPSSDGLVAGQQYEVVSQKHFTQGAYLNAYDYDLRDLESEEPEFYERYTALPERGSMEGNRGFDFSRIRAKAYEITAGDETIYEKVDSLLNFLQDDYRFSLNPPSAVPGEMDAVDYFLFEWEPARGHCEYFSSSLAVLCRSIGIPSRVVTGYTTGNYNILRNRYIVQERHAHAWVEVFWPEIGWVEFDPAPQSWYQGLGEKAAGGWLAFHNAIENLYVYDPRGYFNDKILPALQTGYGSVAYFMNQRELDFIEFSQPMLFKMQRDKAYPLWLLAIAFAVLLASFIVRRKGDKAFFKREALKRGDKTIQRLRKMLIRDGIDPELLATETDLSVHAVRISPSWSTEIGRFTDSYQRVRYSGRHVTSKMLNRLKSSGRQALSKSRAIKIDGIRE